jgi:DNA-binding Xre family transcriptional regulator
VQGGHKPIVTKKESHHMLKIRLEGVLQNVKELDSAGVTPAQLAKLIDVEVGVIAELVGVGADSIEAEVLGRLCELFVCQPGEILTLEDREKVCGYSVTNLVTTL